MALYTDTDFSRKLKPAMLRVGRRVYFRTLQVTEALDLDQPTDDEITSAEAATRGPRA
ncbi:putative plasmid-related protein [plant metagenome]|uniref:Putative plasmid-related protein n=1 Tax=plant metagenome TaxID=1297885 RepID=A0A484P4F8_9ZZZZ